MPEPRLVTGKSKSKPKPPKRGGPWRSRIVGHAEVPAGQLLGHEQNWRIHGLPQQNAMRALLGHDIGWIQGVIVNKRTDPEWEQNRFVETVLDGHLRAQLALKEGEETPVPVTYVDLDPRAEKLALASFDRIGALAGEDDEQYDSLLAGLADVSEDLTSVLARRERKPHEPRGLKPCTCCEKKCSPGCVCWKRRQA